MANQLVTKNSSQITTTDSVKLLVFSMGKLRLALPVNMVQKVQKYSPIYGSGTSYVNITCVEEQTISIIDLHQKLFGVSHDELVDDGGYFIITRPVKQVLNESVTECLGIRVVESPSLLDISWDKIKTLPQSYRQADTLKVASHVAMIELQDPEQEIATIFILDLQSLV